MGKKKGGRKGQAGQTSQGQPQPGPSTPASPQEASTSRQQPQRASQQPQRSLEQQFQQLSTEEQPKPSPSTQQGAWARPRESGSQPPPQQGQLMGGPSDFPGQQAVQGQPRRGPPQQLGTWGRPRESGFQRERPTSSQQFPQGQPRPGQEGAWGRRGESATEPPPGFGRETPTSPQQSFAPPSETFQQPGPGYQAKSERPGWQQQSRQQGGRGRGKESWGESRSGQPRQQAGRGQPREGQATPRPGYGRGTPTAPPPRTVPYSATTSASDEEFKKLLPYKPGTLGRKIILETNHLKLDLGNLKEAYRYDVAVEPDKPKKMLKMAMRLFREAYFPDNNPSYDGQKLLYSAKKLPLPDDTVSGTVKLMDDNGKEKEFKITIKMSGVVDFSPLSLSNLLQKNVEQADAFQCVEIVFRQAYISSFISVGRRFYTPPERRDQYPVGDGAEMYLGGYQGTVKGYKHFLNVDVAHKAFTTAINLKDLVNEMFNARNPLSDEEMKTYNLRPRDCEKMSSYLKGLKVVYQIPNHPGSKKVYRMNGLAETPSRATFKDDNNQTFTVADYFNKKYHYRIKFPDLPTVWVGTKGRILLPIECCTLKEGQPIDGNKMTSNQVSKMIRHAATSTTIRKQKIQDIINRAGYNRNPCLVEFGFRIADEFQKVDGRVLDPPKLQYSQGVVSPKKGVWWGKEFKKGAEIRKWTIVCVGLQRDRVNRDVLKLAGMIADFGKSKGMTFSRPEEPFVYCGDRDRRDISRCLDQRKTYDLIIVVFNPYNDETYYMVKQTAEQTVGCLTQCIKSDTLRKLNQSTIENILLKINNKLNGINHILYDLDLVSKEPCMVMGADVTHPSPQAKSIHPSVVAVTASHDLTATAYNLDVGLQKPRETMSEILQDLENITLKKLKMFKQKTGSEPKRIYFFRDGVSDGEFERVQEVEIKAIEKACGHFRQGYKPKITFLVVQKRHHTRFFPLDDSGTDGDRNFNAPVGTCVDTEIVDPTRQNFFLQSHASIQGVARPTKYCTLYDDNKLTNDEVQKLTYYLCHVFMRCNRAVSYPAPTYYAHLAADRAKGYLRGKHINMDSLDQGLVKIADGFAENNPMFFS